MTRSLITGAILLLAATLLPAVEDATPRLDASSFHLQAKTLSPAQRQDIYRNMIEDFIGWAESSGEFVESDAMEPGGGYFKAKGHGVSWPRGNSSLCLGYALLLRQNPDREFFTMHHIPRKVLEDHLRRAVRSLCLSNQNFSGRRKSPHTWGGPSWQTALDFGGTAWAAWLYPKVLDAETLKWVEEVTTKEADIFLAKKIPSGMVGNTRAEDCAWNTAFQAFAGCRYSDQPHAAGWRENSIRWALNTISSKADASNPTVLDGKPVSEWMVSANLYPDRTLENHGFWSVGYQCSPMLFGEVALAYRIFGRPVPEALGYQADAMWKNVMSVLYQWDGDIMFPNGQDWNWKVYSHIEYLAWQAAVRKNAEAAALESRAIQMIRKRQLSVGTGELGADNFGNQAVKLKRWSFSWLMHEYFKDPPDGTVAAEVRTASGVHVYAYTKAAIHRAPSKCVSVSWHPRSQAIYIQPEDSTTFTDPPFFFPWDKASGRCSVKVVPAHRKNAAAPELIEAGTGPRGGMRVLFRTRWDDAVTQYIGVVSLPDEATVWCTVFHAERPAHVTVSRLFPLHADAPPGFVKPVVQRRGARWLNMSDHIGFISPEPLPAEIPAKEFYLREPRELDVSAGQWFGRAALVAYARQPHATTETLARSVRFEDAGEGEVALRFRSSSGDHAVDLKFAAGR